MSCEHVKVQKSENSIVFLEEPKIKIETGTSLLYSKYITKKLPSIAYHDEPRFLQMQELFKLITGMEWLYIEKNIRFDQEWVAMHTSKLTADPDAQLKRKEPPPKMIPKPPAFKEFSSDVQSWEVERLRPLMKKVESRYGYNDNCSSSMITFEKDGTPCPPEKYLIWSLAFQSNALPVGMIAKFHLPASTCQPAKFEEEFLKLMPKDLHHETASPLSADTTIDSCTDENGMELKVTTTTKALQPSHPLASDALEETMIVAAKNCEPYAGKDPNQVIEAAGIREAVTPNVKSWDELISEHTVPIPCKWLTLPSDGIGLPSAMGGVSTRDFRVQEEVVRPRAAHGETQWIDNFKKSGPLLGVRAEHVRAQGINTLSWGAVTI
jgi:hypothetical protein